MTDLTARRPDDAADRLPSLTAVETPWGAFVAVEDDGVQRIRNIRYATADRFGRPQAVEPDPASSDDLQLATIACPQPPSPSAAVLGDPLEGAVFDEDCLRITVTRPADAVGPVPVLVWIHGGAHVSNAGDLPGFDASALAREHGVLVVAPTFRLGLLGFAGDRLGADSRRPANLGLLDVATALRWVREHVAGFGGDPEQVTVFGQSSGADALAHVLAADGAEGLVSRVVLQSAPFGIRTDRDEMQAKMREAIGVIPTDATTDEIGALQLVAKQAGSGYGLRSGMSFGPEAGQAPLPAEAEIPGVWRRRAAGLDVLVTWTTEETMFFLGTVPKLERLFRVPLVGRLARRVLVGATTKRVYAREGRRFAELLAAGGASVQVGVFDARPAGGPLGAAHAIELPLLFPNEPAWSRAALVAPDGAATLVAAGAPLRAAWVEFARSGRISEQHIPVGAGWRGGLTLEDVS
ncbi:carboxylesterase family protein [Agromyces sp. CF514]|uniref:carboxylesterase family protein n=1 Tax=Agromyces sp. CF514 TaxID=1881031 RepID=UPI0015A4F1B5|nr:carboxylesterase family protein [Agromyces sp. CF514]